MRRPVLSVVTPPDPLFLAADAKAQMHVLTSADDTLITALIAAATGEIDGATGWLGRALGVQTLALTAGHFPGCHGGFEGGYDWGALRAGWPRMTPLEIALPCRPVQSVTSIAYIDPTGAPQTIDSTTYVLANPADDPTLFLLNGQYWPPTACRPDAVKITYVAGYDADALPAAIRAAVMFRVQELYQTSLRDPSLTTDTVFGVGSQQFSAAGSPTLGKTTYALLSPFRVWTSA